MGNSPFFFVFVGIWLAGFRCLCRGHDTVTSLMWSLGYSLHGQMRASHWEPSRICGSRQSKGLVMRKKWQICHSCRTPPSNPWTWFHLTLTRVIWPSEAHSLHFEDKELRIQCLKFACNYRTGKWLSQAPSLTKPLSTIKSWSWQCVSTSGINLLLEAKSS